MARDRIRIAGTTFLAAAAVALAACGGSGGSGGASGGGDAATTTSSARSTPKAVLPARCTAPPVTVDLRAAGEHPAGAEAFEVTDAVARRVPILPGKAAADPAALADLQEEAAATPLALYTVYLADFDVPRAELSGTGFGQVTPPPGRTVGALTLVPTKRRGLRSGDVVVDAERDYDTTTTFATLGLTVYADGDTTGQAYTDTTGQATVLYLDDRQICVDVDVTHELQGQLVYRIEGVVVAPVVRSADAFFFT